MVDAEVSFDGIGYLVVWHNHNQVLGQRISKAGALAGPRFTITSQDYIHELGAVGGDGKHLVLWQDNAGLSVTRVSSDGQLLDPEGRLVAALEQLPNIANAPSLAFAGNSFFVAWRAPASAGDMNSLDLYGVELATTGVASSPVVISEAPENEGAPFVVGAAGQVLAAYARFVPADRRLDGRTTHRRPARRRAAPRPARVAGGSHTRSRRWSRSRFGRTDGTPG